MEVQLDFFQSFRQPIQFFENGLIPCTGVFGFGQPVYVCLLELWFVIILTYGTLMFPLLKHSSVCLCKNQTPCGLRNCHASMGDIIKIQNIFQYEFYLRKLVLSQYKQFFSSRHFAKYLGCQILRKTKLENGGCSINHIIKHASLKIKWLSDCI